MGDSKLDLLQGTLDLMVLQTLASMGSLHGYGIARRISQAAAARLDFRGVGNFRQQSQSEVLFDYETRPQTADARRRVLAKTLGCNEPRTRPAGRRG